MNALSETMPLIATVSPLFPVIAKLTLLSLTVPFIVPDDEHVGCRAILLEETVVPVWRMNMSTVKVPVIREEVRFRCQFPCSRALDVCPPIE